jgi:RNA polymerase-interacting CarD/CdnL/TRCF family regulator
VKARQVLVSELSFALNVSDDDAMKKLEAALA